VGINYKPKYGEEFFYIDGLGKVNSYIWRDGWMDNAYYATGNCYPTEVMALQIVHNRKTLVKLREFAFVPDWEDTEQVKFGLCLTYASVSLETTYTFRYGSAVYFETKELRRAAMQAGGEAAIVDMLEGGLV